MGISCNLFHLKPIHWHINIRPRCYSTSPPTSPQRSPPFPPTAPVAPGVSWMPPGRSSGKGLMATLKGQPSHGERSKKTSAESIWILDWWLSSAWCSSNYRGVLKMWAVQNPEFQYSPTTEETLLNLSKPEILYILSTTDPNPLFSGETIWIQVVMLKSCIVWWLVEDCPFQSGDFCEKKVPNNWTQVLLLPLTFLGQAIGTRAQEWAVFLLMHWFQGIKNYSAVGCSWLW